MQCIVLDMFLILSFGFLCLWPAAAHSRWEGQYDKCIAGGGGADTGRFLCSALFVFLCSSLSHLSPKNTSVLQEWWEPTTPTSYFLPNIHAYTHPHPCLCLYFSISYPIMITIVKKRCCRHSCCNPSHISPADCPGQS